MALQDNVEKNLSLQRESYVVPLSPSKRIYQQQYQSTPDSPDMKHARNRLGNLLSNIRKREVVSDTTPRDDQMYFLHGNMADIELECFSELSVEQEEVKRGPGRPKKSKREKRNNFYYHKGGETC